MFQKETNAKAVAELVRLGRVRDMLEVLRNQAPLEVAPPVTAVEQPQPQAHSQWGYGDGADGPANWGDLSSDWVMCKAGQQQSPIKLLSDGQRSRLVFAMLCMRPVNLLLLDEPTNHLDVDAVDGLARAINAYEGGVVLVSHDFRLIDKVAREIWVCESQKVRRYEGGIGDYKKQLRRKLGLK